MAGAITKPLQNDMYTKQIWVKLPSYIELCFAEM